MSKKFKFSIQGTEFQLPISQVQEDSYNNGTKEKYIYMNAKSAASVIKQFVKKNYPNLKVWSKSSVYSGGSSVDVDVCNPDGTSITDSKIWDDISSWKSILQGGSFDGMYDIYNYREDSPTTDKGTPLKYFPSYIFINNKPKWGSWEYWLNQWNLKDEYYQGTINTIDEFLSHNKTYMTDKEYSLVSSNFKSL